MLEMKGSNIDLITVNDVLENEKNLKLILLLQRFEEKNQHNNLETYSNRFFSHGSHLLK